MSITAEQYRAAIDTQRKLVEGGYHPAIAGAIVRRALGRASACCDGCRSGDCCDGGLGIQQMRSLRRDLDPSIAPRPVIAGEQCVRIQEIPGNETVMYQQIEDYRNRGWNIMGVSRTQGFPSVAVYWACPPGRVPMESQGQILQSSMGVTAPAPAPTPNLLTSVAAAGDDPSVAAARNVVAKWSWIIPVGGLLMSAKQRLTDWRASKTDPAYAASRALRKR